MHIDIDKLLIHQSYSLMKISAINKQMLIAQYAQCEQISALQKEISASNNISRQILKNQLKEIKHQELLRYYKSLAYAMKEAARRIEAEEDIVFKCFLCELYSEPIINNTREAKSNLEEISDKEYCNGIETTMQAICNTYSLYKNEYAKSDFSRLLESQFSYQELQNEVAEKHRTSLIRRTEIEKELSAIKPEPMKNTKRRCGMIILLALFMVFLPFSIPLIIPLIKLRKKDKKWKENYGQYINKIESQKKELLERLNTIKVEEEKEEALLKSSIYIQTKNSISLAYPHWEETIVQIDSYIPKMGTLESRNPKLYKDLYEIASYVIKTQTVSTAMIQRHFSCGYTKAGKYLDRLSKIGIIKDNKVLIQNEKDLKKILENTVEESI